MTFSPAKACSLTEDSNCEMDRVSCNMITMVKTETDDPTDNKTLVWQKVNSGSDQRYLRHTCEAVYKGKDMCFISKNKSYQCDFCNIGGDDNCDNAERVSNKTSNFSVKNIKVELETSLIKEEVNIYPELNSQLTYNDSNQSLLHQSGNCIDTEDPGVLLLYHNNKEDHTEAIPTGLYTNKSSLIATSAIKTEKVETCSNSLPGQANDVSSVLQSNPAIPAIINTIDRPHKCTICGNGFTRKGRLRDHLKIHTDKKPYKCAMCDYRCVRKQRLTLHARTHTGERPYKCTICDKTFTAKSDLSIHLKSHTGEKSYKCTMCDYRCVQKQSLTRHARTHTGEKPYKCTMCDYRGVQKHRLTLHVRTHTGEKPYKCTMCDYRCVQKHSLTLHVRTHTGERPYKCTICEKTFTRKAHLSRHLRIHTAEKPYKSTLCDYKCKQTGILNAQIRTHTGEKLYKNVPCLLSDVVIKVI